MIGSNSVMASYFKSAGFCVEQFGRNTSPSLDCNDPNFNRIFEALIHRKSYSLYIFFSGLLRSIPILQQNYSEISESFFVNSIGPVVGSELIFKNNLNARIFLIGSESARKGSFDMSYALSKSTLKTYVLTKRLLPMQQLLLLSPSTIDDLGMTTRRVDHDRLGNYKSNHPKKRFLSSHELAELIINLFHSSIYLTNAEIEVNGGKFASC